MKGKSALGIVRKYHPEVTRVKDATKGIVITVTAADCKSGRRKGPSSCAMAKAFMRKYDGAIISVNKAYLVKGKTATRYQVPASVAREIVSFDRSRVFAPSVYSLDGISPGQKLGPRRYGKHKVRSHRLVKQRHHRTTGVRSL